MKKAGIERSEIGHSKTQSSLGTREPEQRSDVEMVGGLERSNIALPRGTGITQTLHAPGKAFASQPHAQEIGGQPGMAPVATTKRLD